MGRNGIARQRQTWNPRAIVGMAHLRKPTCQCGVRCVLGDLACSCTTTTAERTEGQDVCTTSNDLCCVRGPLHNQPFCSTPRLLNSQRFTTFDSNISLVLSTHQAPPHTHIALIAAVNNDFLAPPPHDDNAATNTIHRLTIKYPPTTTTPYVRAAHEDEL